MKKNWFLCCIFASCFTLAQAQNSTVELTDVGIKKCPTTHAKAKEVA